MVFPNESCRAGLKRKSPIITANEEVAMIVIQQEPQRVIVNVYGEFTLADYK